MLKNVVLGLLRTSLSISTGFEKSGLPETMHEMVTAWPGLELSQRQERKPVSWRGDPVELAAISNRLSPPGR